MKFQKECSEREVSEKKENFDVKERTIDEAWHMAMFACARNGYKQIIEKGSYEKSETYRMQLESLSIKIEEPWTRPLSVSVSENSQLSPPTDEDKIHEYFYEYLATNTKEDKEDYTYGQYIEKQWEDALNILAESNGYTNQCYITVGDPKAIKYNDPPCLRGIDFKVVPDKDGMRKLNMSLYFRSWDLYAGFPQNIGGLQLLKEKMLMDLAHKGLEIEDGAIFAYSAGAHIYNYAFKDANEMLAVKIPVEEKNEEDSEEEVF